MSDARRHILWLLGGILMLLPLLTSCASGSSEESGQPKQRPVLKFYVFAPDHPIVTRADNGEVDPVGDENAIKNLQIWVYKSDTQVRVGHISLSNQTITEQGATITMELSDAFVDEYNNAAEGEKPKVDVYVVANTTVSNTGLDLDANTSSTQLGDAAIGTNYFGTNTLINAVPVDGLPMSGVIKGHSVSGTAPVLKVDDGEGAMAKVRLVRAVSKVRFVLCQAQEKIDATTKLVSVDDISIDADMIPTTSWLLARGTPSYSYSHTAIKFTDGLSKEAIPSVTSPSDYIFADQSGQNYETLIDEAVAEGNLKEIGPVYFRETDKKVSGTITYTIQEKDSYGEWKAAEQKGPVPFMMADEGDFMRNHTWIVYIYFVESKIHTFTVTHIGMKDWTGDNADESTHFYNW